MDELLQENGDALLLETGGTDAVLLESSGGGGGFQAAWSVVTNVVIQSGLA